MNALSINTAPLTSYLKKKYYDLEATVYIMRMLLAEGAVDGFEFKLLAEWDSRHHPLAKDTKFDRELAWENSEKYRIDEIASILNGHRLPILSVHANQDVGVCLCSPGLKKRGEELIRQALQLAGKVGSGICVFHVWDPWLNEIDFGAIREAFRSILAEYAELDVKGSVENIPVYVPGVSPYTVVKEYSWITLDTKWALKYHELASYKKLKSRIVDVHIHGRAEDSRWLLSAAHHPLSEILHTVEKDWRYQGLFTFDTEGSFEDMKWKDLVSGITTLKRLSAA